jgi:hypothetical protein
VSRGAAAVSWARGDSGAAGLRCSTGSLGPEVELAHQLAASVEHLAASLDITGPQVCVCVCVYVRVFMCVCACV